MTAILKQYKLQNGSLDYYKLREIPKSERIAALAERDFNRVNMLIIASLTMALENMNFKRGLNEFQILNLSEAIIDSAGEDNLSFEDLLIFLQQLVRGKFPMSYESMDIPKFMKALDLYREERWQECIKIRDEQISQWQGLGPSDRCTVTDPLSEHMSKISGRLSDMKAAWRDVKKENDTLKKADEFFRKHNP